MTQSVFDQALEFHKYKSSYRCRFGHRTEVSMSLAASRLIQGSAWDWCDRCSEGPTIVDTMRMKLDILNQWRNAGLISGALYHRMACRYANNQVTYNHKLNRMDRSEFTEEDKYQAHLTNVLGELNTAVDGLEILSRMDKVWNDRFQRVLDDAYRLRFQYKIAVEAAGFDSGMA